jgi:hypothetical protein
LTHTGYSLKCGVAEGESYNSIAQFASVASPSCLASRNLDPANGIRAGKAAESADRIYQANAA